MENYIAFATGKTPVVFESTDDDMALREAELLWPDCWYGIAVFRSTNEEMPIFVGIINDPLGQV